MIMKILIALLFMPFLASAQPIYQEGASLTPVIGIGGQITFVSVQKTTGIRKTIPKNADGGWYKPTHNLLPGDTLVLSGDYKYGYLVAVNGTATDSIVIISETPVKFGAVNNQYGYGLILERCNYVKVVGSITIGASPGQWVAQGLGLPYCNNIRVTGVKFDWCQAAIFSNPSTGGPFYNYKIDNCILTNIGNYGTDAWNCAGVYIGNTSIAGIPNSGTFNNVEFCYNTVDGSMADGIQITATTGANIHHNTIRNFGTFNANGQRTGVVLGGCSSGDVYENLIEQGTGPAMSVFGAGIVTFRNNTVKNVASNPIEPVLYYNKKCTGAPALDARILNNSFDKVYTKFIGQDGGTYVTQNSGNTFGVIYYNAAISQAFTRNNCSPNAGTSVIYTVPAAKYSAATQGEADALATTDLNSNGQSYANTNGVCVPVVLIEILSNGTWRYKQ